MTTFKGPGNAPADWTATAPPWPTWPATAAGARPQVADNLSPLQRLTIECFEDARIDHLVLRQYPGLRPLLLALHPRRSKAPATRPRRAACATGWRCCRAPCWTRRTATATKCSTLL
jgi:hypothetical protein